MIPAQTTARDLEQQSHTWMGVVYALLAAAAATARRRPFGVVKAAAAAATAAVVAAVSAVAPVASSPVMSRVRGFDRRLIGDQKGSNGALEMSVLILGAGDDDGWIGTALGGVSGLML